MPPKWTAEVVGQMHLLGITEKQLAERAGLCSSYLSEILHGVANRNTQNRKSGKHLKA